MIWFFNRGSISVEFGERGVHRKHRVNDSVDDSVDCTEGLNIIGKCCILNENLLCIKKRKQLRSRHVLFLRHTDKIISAKHDRRKAVGF